MGMPIDRSLLRSWFALAVSCAIVCCALFADAGITSRQLLISMAANAKRMMKYEWKQRITVVRKGTPTEPTIAQISFDANGKMQRTVISAPEQKEMHGIRGRVAAGVKEDVKGVMELAASYNKPQQMIEAVKKAQMSGSGNPVRLLAKDVVQSGDQMTMLVDTGTLHATHITFLTNYDGSPVTIEQDYKPVPNGPNMMQTMKVSVPAKSIVVNIDSYDFKAAS